MGTTSSEERRRGATARRAGLRARLACALRCLATRVGMIDRRADCFRQLVRISASAGLSRSQIVSRVAEAMFRQAESAGAFVRGGGLLGPWLYEQDAEQLVAAVLNTEDGDGPRAHG